jgi:transcriptional regulator with XRE-family HTH domain
MPDFQKRETTSKDLDPAASPRALYGAELRHYRRRAGLSQVQLAELLYVTPSFVANLEAGRRRVPPELAAMLDKILDTGDFFVRNLRAGRSTTARDRVAHTTPLEKRALTVQEWNAVRVPGPLRTKAYARALARTDGTDFPGAPPPNGEADRPATRGLLDGPNPPRYTAVLTEAALRRTHGDAPVMAAQLRHLAELVHSGRAVVRVLPLAVAPPLTGDTAFKLLTFPEDRPAAYLACRGGWTPTSDPAQVEVTALAYHLVSAASLPPDESLHLIEAVAAQHEARTP